ncbi:kelch-like protein [Trifolium pratense]|uniref:Kelch-like protein n=1 Tax=Trifolium pratense TaxID=57577 RepID=A0A2K3K1L3_TRIPR|nr:kelch-like protein [Trifolium pratense]
MQQGMMSNKNKTATAAGDSLFLIGGSTYNVSTIADMDMYCTSQNVIKSLKPMNCPRSYASVAELNGRIYVFGGENDYIQLSYILNYPRSYLQRSLAPHRASFASSLHRHGLRIHALDVLGAILWSLESRS